MTEIQETEMVRAFKPCPFCGITPVATKHFSEDMWRLIHRCRVMGPMILEWSDIVSLNNRWNTRLPPTDTNESKP